MRDGVIRFVPQKTKRKKMHAIEIPVAPELAKIIAATSTGDMTFLMTEWGKPFTFEWIRQLVSRPLQRRRAASMQRARIAQGGRDDRSRARRDRPSAYGDVRLGERPAGDDLHGRRGSQAPRCRCGEACGGRVSDERRS
jgi:hypothetical protein